MRPSRLPFLVSVAVAASLLPVAPARAQLGVAFTGAGAVNRSMGGASTAAPLDASGALYWNPATLSGLPRSEVDFSAEALYVQSRVSSSVAAGALGPGFPPVPLAGSDRGENGVFALPTFALAYIPEDPDWTLGFGVFSAGGFGVNYQGDLTNPVLSPRPPAGIGLGPVYTNFQVVQFVPGAAYRVTDRLSVGAAPVLDMALLQIDPGIIAPPDDANGDGFPTYPSLTHTRYQFGGGFELGLGYRLDDGWELGASVKSPQWFETFRWHSSDELGQPRTDRFHADFPMIVSTGVAYRGFDRWLLEADFRYVDYANTAGFRESGFDANGALRGLGWRSIFALAVGAQYQLTDALTVRLGYSFNQNPIPNSEASENVGAPVVIQHTLYLGASYRVSEALLLSAAYLHAFGNSIEGPLVSAAGPVPDTQVQDTILGADALVAGLTVQFGAAR